jgi:hypothetical protein
LGLARLPDVIGLLAAAGYLLFRDGLFAHQSVGKKLIGIRIAPADDAAALAGFRESVIRNVTLAVAFLLFKIPYAGWVLGPLAVLIECLTALGDERAMRVGDLLARTWAVRHSAAAPDNASAPQAPGAEAPPAPGPAEQG